jgi:DtxR family Mn-dependent transcriptional regulator
MDRTKQVHLTAKGREAAVSVVRRHMLTELLLARVLGIPWSQVHAEADRMEHNMSASTADRVAELMSDSTHCPHGNPMPGHEGLSSELVPLLEAEITGCYTLARVHEEIERNPELMGFLEEHGLVPGAQVQVSEIAKFNETVTVLVGEGHAAVLGLSVARYIWLSPLV